MRAIDADRLQKKFDEKSINPNYRVNMHNIKSIISNAPTVDAVPKEKIAAATNKIISCSLGKWYVGRTDGAPDEVVLLDDVLRVMSELLEDRI